MKIVLNFRLFIEDTLKELNIQRIELFPWLKAFIPINEKTEDFFTYIAKIMGFEKLKDLQIDGQEEEIKYSELHFEEADSLQMEADKLYLTGDILGALEKMNNAIEKYENSFKEYKVVRGFSPDHFIVYGNNPIAHAYFNKAKILVDLNRMDEAFICQDKAIELDPNNPKYT